MPDSRQWRLSEKQRLAAIAATVLVVFLSCMAVGMGSVLVFLASLLIAAATGVGTYLAGSHAQAEGYLRRKARVVRVNQPQANVIVDHCELDLLIPNEQGAAETTRVRLTSIPVIRWPAIGMELPVDVSVRNPQEVHVRWEQVPTTYDRPAPGFTEPSQTTLDPRPEPADGTDLSVADNEPTDSGLDIDTDLDRLFSGDEPAALPPEPTPISIPAPEITDTDEDDGADPEAEDPEGEDPGGTGVDHRPDSADAAPVARHLPAPRPPKISVEWLSAKTPADVQAEMWASAGASPGDGDPGVGAMLIVSDLSRSLRFYRDTLGFAEIDSTEDRAVLSYAGGRILLHQRPDMPPVDRRVAHLHLGVADVDSAYQELRRKGVEFVHRPQVNRVDDLELTSATFRDPDGHAVAITQWRPRPGLTAE